MVGGTFGVAALGALVIAVGRSDLADKLPQLPAGTRGRLAEALGQQLPAGTPRAVVEASHEAFISALGTGLRVGAAAAVVGAVLAWTLVRVRPEPRTVPVGEAPVPEAAVAAEKQAERVPA